LIFIFVCLIIELVEDKAVEKNRGFIMSKDDKQSNFGLLPERIQQEIQNLLVLDKFTQAKELYEQWVRALKERECFV
jgi:hypothetical protein